MHVRVAISQKFDEVFFQFPTRIIAKLVIENTTVVALLEDFVCKPYLFSEVWSCCKVCRTWDELLSSEPYATHVRSYEMREQKLNCEN